MKLTLWQLNQSYSALARLAGREVPKEHHKLAYFLMRVLRSAKAEVEALADSLNDLMLRCGFEPGQADVSEDQSRDYNERAEKFMKESECDLWGDPIAFDKIAGVISVVPADLVMLDWLITEDEEGKPEA